MASVPGELPIFAKRIVAETPLVLRNAPINLVPRPRPNPLDTMPRKTFSPGQPGIGQFFGAGIGVSPQGQPQAQVTGNVPLPGGGISGALGVGRDSSRANLNAQMGNENLMAQIRAAMNKDPAGISANVSGSLNAPLGDDSSVGIGGFFQKFDSAANMPGRDNERYGAGVTGSMPFMGGTLRGDAGYGSRGANVNVGFTRTF